jgi:hypothetical protein
MAPSFSLQTDLVEVFMFFDDCQMLEGKSIINFESVTSDFIEEELQTTSPSLIDLAVGTNVKNQKPAESLRRSNMRVLQASPLAIVFDTVVEFRSTSRDYDVPALIAGAFDTDEDKERYIASLQATGDEAFSNIGSMRVEVNGVELGGDTQKIDDNTLYIIIGASVGGTILVAIVALFFICRRRASSLPGKTVATTQQTTSLDEKRMTTYVNCEAFNFCVCVLFLAHLALSVARLWSIIKMTLVHSVIRRLQQAV